MAWATGAERGEDPLTLKRVTTIKNNKPEEKETPEKREQRHREASRLRAKARHDEPLVAAASAISELRSLPVVQDQINKLLIDAERENTNEVRRQTKVEKRS